MKKIILLLAIVFTSFGVKAQYGCFTPSLGVYDNVSDALIPAVISCSYANVIYITPTTVFSGTQAVLPCMNIQFSTTNANSASNNTVNIFQGGSLIESLCNTIPTPCFTNVPNSSSYSFALAGLNPYASHSYSLCNTLAAANFNYTVSSCYTNTPFSSGVWNNSTSNSCQGVFVPANSPIGICTWTVNPAVPPQAILSGSNNLAIGYLFLDTYFMAPGIYTISMGFNSQVGCTSTAVRTLQILPAYNANWTAIPNQCSQGACVNLNPQITGNTGGSFSGFGVTSPNFCPSSAGTGTFPVTYTVGVTTQCRATFSNNIVVVPSPTLSAPNGSFTCTNPNTVTLTASGASGGSYSWNGPSILSQNSAAGTAVVLANGNYTVNATGANGCTATPVVANVSTNNTPPSISPGSSSNLITCSTLTTAVSVPSVSGITYAWTGPGIVGPNTGNSIVGNAGGNYVVTATNPANGCTNQATVTASQNNTVTNTASTTGTITCAVNNINLSTTASSPVYNITWAAPSGATLSATNLQNVTATMTNGGTFTVSVLNTINGCTNTSIISANINTAVITPTSVSASSTTLNCNVTAVTLNGNPASGVTYSWTGPASYTSNVQNPSVSNPGTYSLVVTNTVNGCKNTASSATVAITQNITPPTITATTATNPSVTCAGASTVAILGASLGSGGTSYQWSNGPTTSTVSVGAGTFAVYAINSANGCTSTPITFTVAPPSGAQTPTLLANSLTLSCTQTLVTNAITNSGSGLTYNWSGPGIQGATTNSNVNITQAGTYNYTLTNASNCSIANSFIVSTNTTNVVPNATVSNTINCNNTSATLSVAPSPTSSAYTYSWSTNATTPSISVNPTTNTSYTVVVTNTVNGCKGTQVVTVNTNTVPPASVGLSPAAFTLACSPPNTVLTATASGATSYSWASSTGPIGATTNTISVNAAGTYSVFAIGANGCSSAAQVSTISANLNAPQISLSNSNPSITCLLSAASVSVVVTSTVPIQSYTWGPASGISGATNTNVVTFTTAGTYTGVILATNGCPTNTTVIVTSATASPAFVSGTGTAQALSCTNPTVLIAPTFTPSSNLTFTWTGPGIIGNSNGPSVVVNQNGNYNVAVTNTLTGCVANNLTIPVSGSNLAPTVTVTSSSSLGISCQPNTSTIVLTANSGSALNYTWSTGATTSTISTSIPGTYSVAAFDNVSGCTVNQSFTITNNSTVPSLTASAAGALPCGGGTTTLSALSTNTNTTYTWNGNGIVSGANSANAQVNAGGIYTVTVTDNITNCSNTQTVLLTQNTVAAQFNANVITGPAPLNVNFNNTSIGATTYSWNLGNNQPSSTLQNPSNIYNEAGTYTVQLIAFNGACASTATLEIIVQQGLGEIPEVFTPNGDLYNPTFFIKGLDSYPNNSLEIFNRWGNPVYSAKPYKNDWDGKPNKSSIGTEKLPSGTYYYLLDLGDGKTPPFKGYIQLQY